MMSALLLPTALRALGRVQAGARAIIEALLCLLARIDAYGVRWAWYRYFRAIVVRWVAQCVWLIEFEPTWFPEFGFAVAAMYWGMGAYLTDDIHVAGWDFALPTAAIVGGLVRGIVLMRLWYGARVVLASASALLWAWLWWCLVSRYGIIPLPGLLVGAFLIEVLTAAKFSIPCARELVDEYVEGRLFE